MGTFQEDCVKHRIKGNVKGLKDKYLVDAFLTLITGICVCVWRGGGHQSGRHGVRVCGASCDHSQHYGGGVGGADGEEESGGAIEGEMVVQGP